MTTEIEFDERDLRVFVTHPDDPTVGRTFVQAGRWFERIGDLGADAMAFPHFADSEEQARSMLLEQDRELTELDDEYARLVRREFLERTPLAPYEQERSDEPPFQEDEP
jgi:hypothetical protein